jgi:hypothetical protein
LFIALEITSPTFVLREDRLVEFAAVFGGAGVIASSIKSYFFFGSA